MKKMKAMLKKLGASMAGFADLKDAHAYGGLGMMGYGIHTYSPGAAFIVCGIILFWIGVRR